MAANDKPVTPSPEPISIADLINSSPITTTKLRGKINYLPWSSAIQTFLLSKDKLRYIEEEKPTAASPVWAKEDAQVKSWLWNNMEPHVSCDVMLLFTAYSVWSSVKETYGMEGNIQRIYEDIFLTKKGSKALHEHYSFVKARWEELNLYQPYPANLATWKRQREDLMVISFLSTLGPHYLSAKTQLFAAADLPTLSATFSRLSRIPVEGDDLVEAFEPAAFVTSTKPFPSSSRGRGRGRGSSSSGRGGGRTTPKKDDRFCYFCHNHGHIEEKCWKEHGKPDWVTQQGQPSSCSSHATAMIPDTSAASPSVTLSHADFEHLLNLAHDESSLPSAIVATAGSISSLPLHNLWLVDSRETDHMTKHPQLFLTYKPFQHPSLVNLGDGSLVPAIGKGTIQLNQNLILDDVLLCLRFL